MATELKMQQQQMNDLSQKLLVVDDSASDLATQASFLKTMIEHKGIVPVGFLLSGCMSCLLFSVCGG